MWEAKMKRSRILLLIVCILLAAACISPAVAAEEDVPSIFIGDKEWYRDALCPLITRGGRDYVPVDAFEMADGISVTISKKDNILIHNTATGQYISVIFSNRSAAVNGVIINGMGIFTEEETYYVDAETVSEAIGLKFEVRTVGEARRTVRIFGADVYYTFDELIAPFASGDDDGPQSGELGDSEVSGGTKRIYILCAQSETGMNEPQFSANELLRAYGLRYTMFIYDPSRTEDVISAAAQGDYGVFLPYYEKSTAKERLDRLNGDTKKVTSRLTHITVDRSGSGIPDGYFAIEPDFTVNGVMSAGYVYGQITEYFKTHDYCTLFLEDCWNSEQMIVLLSKLDQSKIITSNLAGDR